MNIFIGSVTLLCGILVMKMYNCQTMCCICNSNFLLAFILVINETLINFTLRHVTVILKLLNFHFSFWPLGTWLIHRWMNSNECTVCIFYFLRIVAWHKLFVSFPSKQHFWICSLMHKYCLKVSQSYAVS